MLYPWLRAMRSIVLQYIGYLTSIVIICLLNYSYAMAEIVMSQHNMNLPVEITSDTLEVTKNAQTAVFNGNVQVTQGKLVLTANTITVHYQQNKKENTSKNNMPVKKIIADGQVKLNTTTEQASSDQGVYDVEQHMITLNKHVVLQKGKNIVTGSKLIYNLKTGKSQLIEEPVIGTEEKKRVRGVFVPE